MKKYISLFAVISFLFTPIFAQTIDFKDGSSNTLIQIFDEGSVGSIFLPRSTASFSSTDKLYNLNGTLIWNGSELGTSASAAGWTSTAGKIYNTTLTDRVGIGTNSPLSVLHLRTQDNWKPTVGDGWGDFSISDGTKGLAIGMAEFGGGAGDIRIWAKGGTERIMIGDVTNGDVLTIINDKVGIGTLDPEATLDVRSSGIDVGSQIQIGNSDRSHVLTLYPGRQTDPNPFLSWIDTDALRFVTFSDAIFNGYNELMRVESSGNVGIGVEDPDAKLEVNGQIKITGGTPGDGKVLTSDADGLATWEDKKIGFHAYLSTSTTLVNATETQLTTFSEYFDDGNAFDNSTGAYTIPADGVYQFNVHAYWSSSAHVTDSPTLIRIKNGGTIIAQAGRHVTIDSHSENTEAHITAKLNTGDVITFHVLFVNSTTPLSVNGGPSSGRSFVSGFKVY